MPSSKVTYGLETLRLINPHNNYSSHHNPSQYMMPAISPPLHSQRLIWIHSWTLSTKMTLKSPFNVIANSVNGYIKFLIVVYLPQIKNVSVFENLISFIISPLTVNQAE